MNAVQVMRDRAEKAGNLKSTSQETVTQQGQTIVIEPADPEVVYVPEYDPWLAYGEPIGVWPGWYPYPGLFLAGPGIGFGFGFGVGFFGGFGWGWHHWGTDWHGRNVVYNHNTYLSRSRIFANHNTFNHAHGNFNHGGGFHAGGGFHTAALAEIPDSTDQRHNTDSQPRNTDLKRRTLSLAATRIRRL